MVACIIHGGAGVLGESGLILLIVLLGWWGDKAMVTTSCLQGMNLSFDTLLESDDLFGSFFLTVHNHFILGPIFPANIEKKNYEF